MSEHRDFDQDKFGRQLARYGEWIGAAYKAGDGSECRLRAETAVHWLEEQRQLAPYGLRPLIDQTIRDMNAMMTGLPESDRPYPALDIAEFSPDLTDDQIARKHAEEHLAKFESLLPQIESPGRESLAYCLNATKGQAAPDSVQDWDHLLISSLTKLSDATTTKNNAAINESLRLLKKWTATATLAPGYERSDIERHMKIIADALVPDRPTIPNKFLGHGAQVNPSSGDSSKPHGKLFKTIFSRLKRSSDRR